MLGRFQFYKLFLLIYYFEINIFTAIFGGLKLSIYFHLNNKYCIWEKNLNINFLLFLAVNFTASFIVIG